ncbi:Fe(3+)-hydroxamate ABC transporter substrate-binding protein FhuD [Vibrio rumoiensis]|uniref:Peptide ABC transporter substrate-binding protein n=1 Tax=Vibrio rumoiensis 1S-45 TaxID=1188252 RepID=A0A1E5DZH4_9VIBR|nr:Fe(3+)-hydroxamate ABC transporter substrate-binding protein FhuD [Vibrio rumoiensis]OEF23394.1 peptide ABC transporter substrate-binding protein [Vibrio rumoiensis 1S-45]
MEVGLVAIKSVLNRFIMVMSLMMLSLSSHAQVFKHEMGEVDLPKTPVKVVALDWVLTEHLLALGVTPYGVADVKGYQGWVVEPALPESVISVGSRREPNLELLAQIKPDLIVMSDAMSPAYEKLNAIAPTMVLSVYTDAHQPLEAAKQQLLTLGKVLNRSAQAEKVIADFDQTIQTNKQALAAAKQPASPLLFIRFIGDKHIRVHGNQSLAGETISAMGLTNAWIQEGNTWGFSSTTIQQLAPLQNAQVFYFGPLSEDDNKVLTTNPIWNVMGFVREHRVHELPAVWTFGGVKAAQRLSELVTKQLLISESGQE